MEGFKNLDRPLSITKLVFTPDGKKIISGTMGGKVQMWDVETGTELCTFLEGQWFEEAKMINKEDLLNLEARERITDLALSTNGNLLAVTSLKQTYFFDCEKMTQIEDMKFPWPDTLAFSPDDKLLINGRTSGNIELWDIPTGKKRTTLEGHRSGLSKFAVSDDGKTMTSIGAEGTILIWDWEEI